MLWSLDMDDFSGEFCHLGRYPLLKALNEALKTKLQADDDDDDDDNDDDNDDKILRRVKLFVTF